MILNEIFETMLKEIAAAFGYTFKQDLHNYILSNEEMTVGFRTFVTRQGKLKITMTPENLTKKLIDLGDYTLEELKEKDSRVKNAIIIALTERRKKRIFYN